MKRILLLSYLITANLLLSSFTMDDSCYNDAKYSKFEINSIIEYGNHQYLSAHHPVTVSDKLNKKVDELITCYLKNFNEEADGFFNGPVPKESFDAWKHEAHIDYETYIYSDDIMGISFIMETYKGCTGTSEIHTLSYNLKEDRFLLLKDIFINGSDYLEKISIKCRELLNNTTQNSKWMQYGTEPSEENYKYFAFDYENLYIFFPIFQISPQSYRISIPLKDLENILNLPKPIITLENNENLISISRVIPPKRMISKDKPMIAFTFDDGPHPEITSAILDGLKKYNGAATFFVLGKRAEFYPDIVKRIISEGSEIGNHSWSHPLFSRLTNEEIISQISKTQDVIEKITGIVPSVIRTPYGEYSDRILSIIDMPVILWSVDTRDWESNDAKSVVDHIISTAGSNDIVLQHDIFDCNINVIDEVLAYFAAKNYQFVTVSELLDLRSKRHEEISGKTFYKRY